MTVDQLLALARRQIGVKENPANSNTVLYNTAYYNRKVAGSNYPWCCTFVWWLFHTLEADSLFYGGRKTAYCPTLLEYHKKQGQHIEGDYQPGDVIFFNFSGKKTAAHVGVCESFNGVSITTIDGNTGSGNEADGGAVMRRTRNKKYIVGAYRPNYETTPKFKTYDIPLPLLTSGATGEAVEAMQILLTGRGYSTHGFDGKFGAQTGTALGRFQEAAGLDADKKCGPATWQALIGYKEGS